MLRHRSCRALLLVIGLLLLAPGAWAAYTKDQCIDANTNVQSLRRVNKLDSAREFLRVCLDPSCPAIVSADCAERLQEIDRVQPTIIFDVKDVDGHDLTAVWLSIDGRPFVEQLDGAALAVDPGPHEFVFRAAGVPPVTRTFVLKETEKARRESIALGERKVFAPPAQAPATVSRAKPEAATSNRNHGRSPSKTAGYVLGGAGLAGVAVGAIFGSMASRASSMQKQTCDSSSCSPKDYERAVQYNESAKRDATASTVSFVAGGALLATGMVLYFASPPVAHSETRSWLELSPTVGRAEVGVLLQGSLE